MLKTETLNAERTITNSGQTGRAANRMDMVKGKLFRRDGAGSGEITTEYTRAVLSSPRRFGKKNFLASVVFLTRRAGQVDSRTRMRPTSDWISPGFQAEL